MPDDENDLQTFVAFAQYIAGIAQYISLCKPISETVHNQQLYNAVGELGQNLFQNNVSMR